MSSTHDSWQPRVLVLPSSVHLEGRTIGGGERYAAEYTRGLASLTHAEQALFHRHPVPPEQAPLHTRVFHQPQPHTRFFARFPSETWRALGQYDVIHVMCFPMPVADSLLASAILHRQILILTDIGGGGSSLATYISRIHPRLFPYRLAHGLAHLSAHAGGMFRHWPHPAITLHGGARTLLASGTGTFGGYALFVGRLLWHKGVREVIQALPPGRRLHVVGRPYDPAYFQSLQEAARGKDVRFITDADDAELARQYQGASVVLQPSLPTTGDANDRSELLGLVAIEAQAAGKPVIVTRTTSLPELVIDHVTGRIVTPGNLSELAEALESYLSNPDLAARTGAAAARHAARNFQWESVARRGLDFYRSLASARSAGNPG
jgi:glycosyltransferase involved in cell wall biosynthesis